jgi:hypothetical protein
MIHPIQLKLRKLLRENDLGAIQTFYSKNTKLILSDKCTILIACREGSKKAIIFFLELENITASVNLLPKILDSVIANKKLCQLDKVSVISYLDYKFNIQGKENDFLHALDSLQDKKLLNLYDAYGERVTQFKFYLVNYLYNNHNNADNNNQCLKIMPDEIIKLCCRFFNFSPGKESQIQQLSNISFTCDR